MKRKRRLEKVKEEKPLCGEFICGIPIEFILITIIMVTFFLLIMIMMGPCTESGIQYNLPKA